MIHFILVRHGDTLWTTERRYQGSTDLSLSSIGKKKMSALANMFRRVDTDLIYTSALARAKESGQMLARAMKIKVREDARLNEADLGRWEGKTAQQLLAQGDPVYQKWVQGRWVTPPGGESVYSLKRRIRKFLSHCLKHHEGKKIVIVSHGGTIRMIVLELLKLPLKYMFYFRIDPASVTVLKHYPNTAQLICLNNREPNGF